MKITLSRDDLLGPLQLVSGVVEKKQTKDPKTPKPLIIEINLLYYNNYNNERR